MQITVKPLQGLARKQGNSVFVDAQFEPYPDQWAFLSSIHKLSVEEFELVCQLHARGNVLGNLVPSEEEPKPWEKKRPVALTPMDFPRELENVRANLLYLPVKDRKTVPDNAEYLMDYGIQVVFRSGFHQKFTVIDGRICWYGSVNILSFGKSEESVMRLESSEIAGELIDTVTKEAEEIS